MSVVFLRIDIPVRLINVHDNIVKIHKGTKIGCIDIFEGGADNVAENVRMTNEKTFDCSHIQYIIDAIKGDNESQATLSEKEMTIDIIREFQDIFSRNKMDVGFCPRIKHEIHTENVPPVALPMRRIPVNLEEKVDDLVND